MHVRAYVCKGWEDIIINEGHSWTEEAPLQEEVKRLSSCASTGFGQGPAMEAVFLLVVIHGGRHQVLEQDHRPSTSLHVLLVPSGRQSLA